MAGVDDLAKGANDVRLELEIHGQVGVIPIAKHAEAFEVFALTIHLCLRVFSAGLTESRGIHLPAGLADLFLHVQFDGQTVAIPARHIGRIKTAEGLGLDDDVFEHLVDRMADVDVAVGVGRTVVQDEFVAPGTGLAQLLIQAAFLPLLQQLRLALGQIAAHGKIGLGQVQGRFIIGLVLHIVVRIISHVDISRNGLVILGDLAVNNIIRNLAHRLPKRNILPVCSGQRLENTVKIHRLFILT